METNNAYGPDEGHDHNVKTVRCENEPDGVAVVQASFDEMDSSRNQEVLKHVIIPHTVYVYRIFF